MSAYVVAQLTVINPEKFAEYGALAAPSVAKFKGSFLVKAPLTALHGETGFQRGVIIEFPDVDTARAWYESEDYQSVIATRSQGIDCVFMILG